MFGVVKVVWLNKEIFFEIILNLIKSFVSFYKACLYNI